MNRTKTDWTRPRARNDASVAEVRAEAKPVLRLLAALNTKSGVLGEKVLFDGGDVLACRKGAFRFSFGTNRKEVITLRKDHALVIYPGNVVTIEALEKANTLNYAIYNGDEIEDFFNQFGFYDHLTFPTASQDALFTMAAEQFKAGKVDYAFAFMTDALRTFEASLRQDGHAALYDAIKLIQRNLSAGITRLKPIYSELNVSRATLSRYFARAGLESPGAFQRNEQLRRARVLLTTTNLPIREIAQRVCIPSAVYFTSFMRAYTGHNPSEIRRLGLAAK